LLDQLLIELHLLEDGFVKDEDWIWKRMLVEKESIQSVNKTT